MTGSTVATVVVAAVLAAASLALASCGGNPASPSSPIASTAVPTPTATAASPTESVSATASSSVAPAVDDDVDLPAKAPTTFDADVDGHELDPGALAPRGARIASSDARTDAIAFAWTRGDDPLAPESGFEVWARSDGSPPWRVVYAFTDRPASGVLGVRFDEGDLTGDGIADALTLESTGGSGACGTWRVVRIVPGNADEILSRQTCDAEARIVGGDLAILEAVFGPGDAHCCPSAYRTTTLHWSGERWKVSARSTQPV